MGPFLLVVTTSKGCLQNWFCSTSYEVSLICNFHGRADQISSQFWEEDRQATAPCDLNTTTGDNVPVTACPLSHSRICTYFLVSTEAICPGGSSIRSAKCGWSRMKSAEMCVIILLLRPQLELETGYVICRLLYVQSNQKPLGFDLCKIKIRTPS